MMEYVKRVKRGFQKQHGFRPDAIILGEPIFLNIPDGIYPMKIYGKTDWVRVKNGGMQFCCFERPKDWRKAHKKVNR